MKKAVKITFGVTILLMAIALSVFAAENCDKSITCLDGVKISCSSTTGPCESREDTKDLGGYVECGTTITYCNVP